MSWTYLFIASMFEIAWTFSLKFLDFRKIKGIDWNSFFSTRTPFFTLAPLLGYIVFGLGNIYCFSVAMKGIRTSTAMAVWLGTTLIGVKLVDLLYFKEPAQPRQLLFFGLILAGVIGLRKEG